jgi:hypothetical protein
MGENRAGVPHEDHPLTVRSGKRGGIPIIPIADEVRRDSGLAGYYSDSSRTQRAETEGEESVF